MRSKKLSRQLKKVLEFEEIDSELPNIQAWIEQAGATAPAPKSEALDAVVTNFSAFLDAIDASYEQYETNLTHAQRSLELSSQEVEERNKLLRQENKKVSDLLNNMRQAVFTVDKQGLVVAPVSRFADAVFGRSVVGESIYSVVFPELDPQGEEISGLRSAMIGVFGEDELQWSLLEGLFPRRAHVFANEAERALNAAKILKIATTPVWDDNSNLERIMFIVEDVTEVEKLERAMAEERAKSNRSMQIIQELAGMPRAQIGDFLGRSVESVSEVKQLLQSQAKPDFDLIFRHLHTVKGNARGFKLNMISGAAHRVESLVAPCRGGQGAQTWLSNRDHIFDELFQLQQQLGDYTDLAQRVLGIDSKRHGVNEASAGSHANPSQSLISALRPLIERMGQQVKHPLMAEVEAILETASRVPVRPALEQLKYMALDLAQELGKSVDVEILDVGDTALKPAVLAPVQDALMHLVRNAVDHGLEAPSDRKDAGKGPQGKITLACVESPDGLVIRVDDDGRGLDAEAIAIRASHLGLVDENTLRAMSSSEKLALIFMPGFTTKREVSEISGRGSGLDAAKVDIEKSGGRIEIKTEPGRGTTFAIVFPRREQSRATGAA